VPTIEFFQERIRLGKTFLCVKALEFLKHKLVTPGEYRQTSHGAELDLERPFIHNTHGDEMSGA